MYETQTEKELLRAAADAVNAVPGSRQGSVYMEQIEIMAETIPDRDRLEDLADDLQFLASDIENVSIEAAVDAAMYRSENPVATQS